ncbi:antitoxin [uncultured Jatrophihabitans sp.]|uniref:antitoxin n=1 Tax=uncultured Jatrophihabitans sp. TaxID=1610747 RepID=UPI0035CC14F8
MRTTLSIDDDVLAAVGERARREKRTAGQVLSDLARQAMTATPEPADTDEFLGFRPLPASGQVVTNSMIDKIRVEIGE